MRLFRLPAILILLTLTSCGYGLQTATNPLLEREKVKKVYFEGFKNSSIHPGVEVSLYNQVLKQFASQRRVQIVSSREEADAIFSGMVTEAGYSVAGVAQSQTLFQGVNQTPIPQGRNVAVTYVSALSGQFSLVKKETGVGLWGGSYRRTKDFPSSHQLGVFGTTGSVTNYSEFQRAIGDLAIQIAADAHDDLFTAF